MRIPTLLIVFGLTACESKPLPRENHAVKFVKMVDPDATCYELHTGAEGILPDTAYCRSKGAVYWCEATLTAKPKCDLLVNTSAEAQPPPAAPAKP